MKKVILAFAVLLVPTWALAAPVTSAQLMGLGMPAQLAGKVSSIGNGTTSTEWGVGGTTELTLSDDKATFSGTTATLAGAGTLLLSPANDTNRLFTLGTASDSAFSLLAGDGGTTATQTFTVALDSADGDDDGTLCLAGADACTTNGTRGGYMTINGNEASGGSIALQAGNVSGGQISMYAPHSTGVIQFGVQSASNEWEFNVTSARTVLHQNAATAGDIELSATGSALSIQEGTAASACMGTVTFNGTTAVTKSTTCATTGSRIFLTPTSDPTGATAAYCWVTNIVNATSFDVDCDQANDGTANWIIFHEAPAL